jgi:hypothetical protein
VQIAPTKWRETVSRNGHGVAAPLKIWRNENMNEVSGSTGRLPDFIFCRRPEIELECGHELAGMLITDIGKGSQMRKRDYRLIQQIIREMRNGIKDAPDFDVVGIWRSRTRPEDGLSPPFDENLLEERSRRCICVLITSGPQIRLPRDLLRQISGGGDH